MIRIEIVSGRGESTGECEAYCSEWPYAREATPTECFEHARKTGHTVFRQYERGTYYRPAS